jgi:hypothetical protein
MTSNDLALWTWDHRETLVALALGVMGWSSHPPRWLVRAKALPFAQAAVVLRAIAKGLDWIAGEVATKPAPVEGNAETPPGG